MVVWLWGCVVQGTAEKQQQFLDGGLLCAFRKFSLIIPRMRIGRMLDLHYAACVSQSTATRVDRAVHSADARFARSPLRRTNVRGEGKSAVRVPSTVAASDFDDDFESFASPAAPARHPYY